MAWILQEENGCVVLEMNSNKANLHNPEFFSDFHAAMDLVERDHPFAPLILTALGRIFSAGIDFSYAFSLFERGDLNEVGAWLRDYQKMMLRLFVSPRLTVAAINGHTFAGGMILALCCDFRIAARGDFKLSINEVPVGVPTPSVYTEIIRFRLGNPAATETILSGEVYGQEQALRLGLIKKLVEPSELRSAALAQARCIQPESYRAYRHSKKTLIHPVLAAIQSYGPALDQDTLREVCAPDSLQAQRRAFEKLK